MCEPDASCSIPAQPARSPSQIPPRGPAGDRCRLQQPLGVQEGPGVALGLPEVERIGGEEERREGQRGERASPVPLTPGEQREGGQQRNPRRPGQEREAGHSSGGGKTAALGEHEGGEREQEVEGLAVDRLQEEGEWEDGQVEDGSPGPVGAEPLLGDPVQKQERAEGRQKRDEDPGEHVVAEEHAAEHADRGRVEGVERRGRS